MTAPFRFGILAPMPSELRPVVKAFGLRPGRSGDLDGHVGTVGAAEVVATTTGIGLERGAAATRRLLDGTDIDHVVVVGIAGGIGPSVGIADVVVPEVVTGWPDRAGHQPAPLGGLEPRGEIVSSDEYGYPPETIAAFIDSGVVAVDMETVAVAGLCAERGVPWSTVRAISDRADDDTVDEAVLDLAKPDGSPDVGASVRYLLRHPGRLPRLARLARDATAAASAAARTAARACAEAR
jgi:adenosylhomocysteine nucleosidase